jgi:hypothetical protein
MLAPRQVPYTIFSSVFFRDATFGFIRKSMIFRDMLFRSIRYARFAFIRNSVIFRDMLFHFPPVPYAKIWFHPEVGEFRNMLFRFSPICYIWFHPESVIFRVCSSVSIRYTTFSFIRKSMMFRNMLFHFAKTAKTGFNRKVNNFSETLSSSTIA